METYLMADYELIRSGVAPDGTLAVTLTQYWDLYLEQLPNERRQYLLSGTLEDALKNFRYDRSLQHPDIKCIPQFAREQLSSAYEVIGRKLHVKNNLDEKLYQEIYEQRRMNLLRIQEIEYYSLQLLEKKGEKTNINTYILPNIPGFNTEIEAKLFLNTLKTDETKLILERDDIIKKYLT
jgi:hypothetical protein